MKLAAWKLCGRTPQPRAGCAVAAEGDKVFVAGGTYWEDGRKIWTTRADCFAPATGAWSARPDLPHPIGDAAGVMHGGRFLVAGGGTADEIFAEIWQLDAEGWSRFASPLPAGRRSFVLLPYAGELLVLGGLTAGPTDYAAATSVVWRGGAGGWTSVAPMPGPARLGFAAGNCDGRIVVAGGFTAANGGGVANLDEILAYDPAADAWTQLGRLPCPVRGVGGLVLPGQGLLVFGGYTDAFSREIQLVDPRTGSVAAAGLLPTALADGRFVWSDGRVVGLTGEDGIKLRYASCVSCEVSVR
jgi:non-specific serine/threonine protein kinase